jgi:tRNA(adenine34) deaminase
MDCTLFDLEMMEKAINIAKQGPKEEVPVAALIVKDGMIIASATNSLRQQYGIHQHAEINAINQALTLTKGEKLNECTLYVTLEPCLMCTGAIVQARIGHVVIGTLDPKGGAMVSSLNLNKIPHLNHYPQLTIGARQEEASLLLKTYFKQKRQ